MTGPKTIQMIVAGQRPRLNTAAEDLNEIMERARTALLVITYAIEKESWDGAIASIGPVSGRGPGGLIPAPFT